MAWSAPPELPLERKTAIFRWGLVAQPMHKIYKFIVAMENGFGSAVLSFRKLIVIGVQLAAVALAYYLANQLRFEFAIPGTAWSAFLITLWPLLACRLATFWYFRLFSGMWRHTTFSDVLGIGKACLTGSALFLAVLWIWQGHSLAGVSRSVAAMEPVLTLLFLVGLRTLARVYKEYLHLPARHGQGRRALVVGAGDRAITAARFILADPQLGLKLEGFVDDDSRRRNLTILSRPVLGTTEDLAALLRAREIDIVLVALGEAPFKKIKQVQNICRDARVPCRVLRSAEEILSESRALVNVGEVAPRDVMQRDAVSFSEPGNTEEHTSLTGKVVLVSGAAGSIGSELCRQIATQEPELLLLLDQNESGLYDINQELVRRAPRLNTREVLCDISHRHKLEHILRKYKPHQVFHAAAYKHVPMMEYEPVESIRVNVLGSFFLGRAALDIGAEKFVLISTDKAVNPVNVMGMSKFMAERLLLSLNGRGTSFMAVRFGNVINSAGSVVPLFRKQVEDGGPVTVTHEDVNRFFMSIEEAAHLVLSAAELGAGREIFLLDMGKPVRIMDVARHVIAQAGLEPNRDIEIRITGLRPGEKLREELYWEGEGIRRTAHPRINCTYCVPLEAEAMTQWLRRSEELLEDWGGGAVRRMLVEFTAQECGSTNCGKRDSAAATPRGDSLPTLQ